MPAKWRWASAIFQRLWSRSVSRRSLLNFLPLETRDVPSGPDSAIPAFDVIKLTALRQDPNFAAIDGRLPGQEQNVGIAIIDTGLYGAHSALRSNFKALYNITTGFFTTDPAQATAEQDPLGHGTHVASTAASNNPNVGVATGSDLIGLGIAGGDILNNASAALSWVLQHGPQYNIKVVNLSVRTGDGFFNINQGGNDTSGIASLIQRLENQGVTVVAASGNNYAAFESLGVEVPAAYASLSVAATWEDNGAGDRFPFPAGQKGDLVAFDKSAHPDRLVTFSQRSTLPNQVAAPGATILGASVRGPDEYVESAGTSMAAPMVSGLVALMQDAAMTFGSRYLPVTDIVRIIRDTADLIVDRPHDQNGYFDPATGSFLPLAETNITLRRINAHKAIQRVKQEVEANKADDLNATIATATPLPPLIVGQPQNVSAHLGSDGVTPIGPNDVDLYRITVSTPGQLAVSTIVPGAFSQLRIRLLKPDGSELPLTPTSNGITTAVSADYLTPGDYFVGISSGLNTSYNIVTGQNRSGGVQQADYKLTVALQTLDPDGTVATAQDLYSSSHLAYDSTFDLAGLRSVGILGFNPWSDGSWQTVGSADVNMYRWLAPDSGYVNIAVHSTTGLAGPRPESTTDFDTFLRVLLPDGSQYIDKYGTLALSGDYEGTTDSYLRVWVDRGQTYFLAVSASGTSTNGGTPNRYDPLTPLGRTNPLPTFKGYYELFVALDNNDLDGTPLTANPLILGTPSYGSLGRTANFSFIGLDGTRDINYYRVTIPTSSLLDFSITGTSGFSTTTQLWLADSSGIPTRLLQSGTGQVLRWLVPVAAGQDLIISVTGAGNTGYHWSRPAVGTGGSLGLYTITTQLRSLQDLAQFQASTALSALPIEVNQALTGSLGGDPVGTTGFLLGATITSGGQIIYSPADLDLYRFVAPFTGQVTVSVAALPELGLLSEPVLVVFDHAGQRLAEVGLNGRTRGGSYVLTTQAFRTYYFGITGRSEAATSYDIFSGSGAALSTSTTGGSYVLLVHDPVITPTVPPPPPPGIQPITPPPVPPPPSFPLIPVDVPITDLSSPPVFVLPPLVTTNIVSEVNSSPAPSPTTTGPTAPLERPAPVASRFFTVNTSLGQVLLYDADRNLLQTITPWPNLPRDLRSAEADFNNDGVRDLVVGTGPGMPNEVKIFDGLSGQQLFAFQPFEASFTGGVFVVTGDLTGDGRPDLVVTPDVGGGPRVRVLDAAKSFQVVADFMGIDDPNFRGGARVAVGDLNRDGRAELFVAAGFGGGPRVAVFDGRTMLQSPMPTRLVADFMVFEATVRNGVYLAVGDLTGDGIPDLVVGGGPSSGPRVSMFDGQKLMQNEPTRTIDFFAGDPASRGGVRLAIKDLDGDQQADLVTTLGNDSSGLVSGYLGRNLTNGIYLSKVLTTLPTIDGVYVG